MFRGKRFFFPGEFKKTEIQPPRRKDVCYLRATHGKWFIFANIYHVMNTRMLRFKWSDLGSELADVDTISFTRLGSAILLLKMKCVNENFYSLPFQALWAQSCGLFCLRTNSCCWSPLKPFCSALCPVNFRWTSNLLVPFTHRLSMLQLGGQIYRNLNRGGVSSPSDGMGHALSPLGGFSLSHYGVWFHSSLYCPCVPLHHGLGSRMLSASVYL